MSTDKKYFPIRTQTSCQLKWNWSTLFLNSGVTRSCHRTSESIITSENFADFHNTDIKILDRQLMLQGKWPESNCGYCRNIEQAGGFSDRMLHLDIPDQSPPELELDPTAVNVSPTILEVFFDNTCNLGCLYCIPQLSSKIADENRKFGPLTHNSKQLISAVPTKNFKSLVPYFWKWFDTNFHTLKRLHILGGEPFYQQDLLDKLLESIDQTPNPHCELNIVTNLSYPQKRLVKYIDQIKELVSARKLKRFDLTASIDCWGAPQEYVRYGINLEQWQQNFEYLVAERWITLNINQTISPLTIKTIPELLERLAVWRQNRKINHYFSGVAPGPSFLKPEIFGPGVFDGDFKKIIAVMPDVTDQDRTAIKYMRGIAESIESADIDVQEIQNMLIYLNEKDRRRNTDWQQVFPWLIEYEELCSIAK